MSITQTLDHPLAVGCPPLWASGWGDDDFGPWVEIDIDRIVVSFRWIPPGRFRMGAADREEEARDNERPQHDVTLTKGFWLQQTPVTQEQWKVVTGENPSHFTGEEELPVESVSWEDCMSFCEALNLRVPELNATLPTEAQWEYACRAGTTTAFHYGNKLDSSMANFNGDRPYGGAPKGEYRQKTSPVANFAPNAWGVFDLHGNVWEWCLDGMRTYHSEAISDPLGPTAEDSLRTVRGGCWIYSGRSCRSAIRYANEPASDHNNVGIRMSAGQEE